MKLKNYLGISFGIALLFITNVCGNNDKTYYNKIVKNKSAKQILTSLKSQNLTSFKITGTVKADGTPQIQADQILKNEVKSIYIAIIIGTEKTNMPVEHTAIVCLMGT